MDEKTINMKPETKRRNRLDLFEPSEKAIYDAMQEVEKLPPDERLTEAVVLLGKAKDLISDFLDESLRKESLLKLGVIIKSGYAGTLSNGNIVDRREHPEAHPIPRNYIFNIPEPKEL